jgi:alpha-glucosidase
LAFLREHPEETLLVVARRAPGPPLDLPIALGETLVATTDDPQATGVTVYAV